MPRSLEPVSSTEMGWQYPDAPRQLEERPHGQSPGKIPMGFGSNVPSKRLLTSRGESPAEFPIPGEQLNLGITANQMRPLRSREGRRDQQGEGRKRSNAKVRERLEEEEASRMKEHVITLEPSQLSALGQERSKGSDVYKLDSPERSSRALHKANSAQSKSEGVGRTKSLPPPLPAKPTIGQQRRAKAEDPIVSAKKPPMRRQRPPGSPMSRAEELANNKLADFMKPVFEVPVAPPMAVMDGFLILESACAELPEEVEVLDISSRSIYRVEEADMDHFASLRDLNLSDNLVPNLEALSYLQNLQFLRASANSLSNLSIPPGMLLGLRELDLSFNCLSAAVAFDQLKALPSLRKLDLSGNSMPVLPPTIAGFTALEELFLACNGLKGPSIVSLQTMPSLKRLLLQDNVITGMPEWTVEVPFPALRELDLTNNHIVEASAIVSLEELPSLRRVCLAGNPLSRKANLAAKKAARAKEAEYRAAGISHLMADPERVLQESVGPAVSQAPLALPAPSSTAPLSLDPSRASLAPELSRIRVELNAAELKPPSLSKTLGSAGLPVVVDDLAKPLLAPGDQYGGMTGAVREEDVSHNAVMEAFERMNSEIQGWGAHAEQIGYGLESVAEGREEQFDVGVEDDFEDNTFLTGVAVEGLGEDEGEETKSQAAAGAGEGDSPEPEEEEMPDPTVVLAEQLGLDPMLLSINSGHLGGDCTAAIKALRFALAHPLADDYEVLRPKPAHHKSTASVRAKQRERYLKPLSGAPKPKPLALDFKVEKIQTIEEILAGMKNRLAKVEGNLVAQIGEEAAELAAATANLRLSGSAMGGALGMDIGMGTRADYGSGGAHALQILTDDGTVPMTAGSPQLPGQALSNTPSRGSTAARYSPEGPTSNVRKTPPASTALGYV